MSREWLGLIWEMSELCPVGTGEPLRVFKLGNKMRTFASIKKSLWKVRRCKQNRDIKLGGTEYVHRRTVKCKISPMYQKSSPTLQPQANWTDQWKEKYVCFLIHIGTKGVILSICHNLQRDTNWKAPGANCF